MSTRIIKKLLKTTRNKKKKRNRIVMLAKRKLNSIGNKISEALTNHEVNHEDFMTNFNYKKSYREASVSSYCLKCKKNNRKHKSKSFKNY